MLVGYDGTPASDDALALADHIAQRAGSELTAVACLPRPGALPAARRGLLKEAADPLFSRAHKQIPRASFETIAVGDPSPVRALGDAASEIGANLVVIGSTHRGPVGRVYPGSVGERLLRDSTVAVAVAPHDYASHFHADIGLIGVAYAGTPESRLALEAAKRLALRVDARLRVMTVIDRSARSSGRQALSSEATEELERHLSEVERFLGPEVDRELKLLDGDPAAALATQGVETDMLIVGSRANGPLGRIVRGRVSSELMRTAPCPLIVVPRAGSPGGATGPSWLGGDRLL